MKNLHRLPLLTLVLFTLVTALIAEPETAPPAEPSPVGLWRTLDEKTGNLKSVLRIQEVNGELCGEVVETYRADEPDPLCVKCEGERRNQPIEGMEILWGFKKDGERWTGGHILDPNNGKTYSCNMELIEGGAKLKVRGFIGISLIGRTQTWERSTDIPPPPAAPEAQPE